METMQRVFRIGGLAKVLGVGWGQIGNAGAVANALAERDLRAEQRAYVAGLQARLALAPGAPAMVPTRRRALATRRRARGARWSRRPTRE